MKAGSLLMLLATVCLLPNRSLATPDSDTDLNRLLQTRETLQGALDDILAAEDKVNKDAGLGAVRDLGGKVSDTLKTAGELWETLNRTQGLVKGGADDGELYKRISAAAGLAKSEFELIANSLDEITVEAGSDVLTGAVGKAAPWGRAMGVGGEVVSLVQYEAELAYLNSAATNILESMAKVNNRIAVISGQQLSKVYDYTHSADYQKMMAAVREQMARANAKMQQVGLSPDEISSQALSDAARRGGRAGYLAAKGLTIVDPGPDVSALSRIPSINPDFILSLQCDQAAIQSMMTGGPGYGGPACPRCRAGDPCDRYADGSYIPAFLAPDLAGSASPSPADFTNAMNNASHAQDSFNRQFQDVQARTNTLQSQIGAAQDQAKAALQEAASARQSVTRPLGSPRSRVPASWVACTCPDKHPHAGLLVNGTRYHSPELMCNRYQ